MRTASILLIIFIVCFSCKKSDHPIAKVPKPVLEKPIGEKVVKPKVLGDFISDDKDYFWSVKQSDTAKYWIRIVFQKEFAVYQFHGQCIYWFFTYSSDDEVKLLWSYKTDCLLDMDFLRQSNGEQKYPKTGIEFCSYTLINDSVVKVKYNFPEWVKEINKQEKDSIFPTYFYLDKSSDNDIAAPKV